jgi:salicylate 5-hydroxylase small subunit
MIAGRITIEDRLAIEDLYARYVAALDERRYDDWLDLFIDECRYRLVSRENDERGLALSLLAFESKGMLQDRIYGIRETLFHEPYYQRHLIVNFILTPGDGAIAVQANYLVIRTKSGQLSEVYNTGRCRDRIVATPDGFRFEERVCVFDSELIPNSLIYPI